MNRYVMVFALVMLLVPGTVSANPEKTFALLGDAEMEMVWIEPGTFMMGAPEDEPGRNEEEGPQHQVTITQGFYLGKYEFTQEQWESVMGTRPWSGQPLMEEGPNIPAQFISWDDWQALIDSLNTAEGSAVYRLPTEAEWEYACRAGTTTIWSFGDDESLLGEYAWYSGNATSIGEAYVHEVGMKLPNPWGLYDMHGNLYEWVQDWYGEDYYSVSTSMDPTGPDTGTHNIIRSGSFHYEALGTRSAFRHGMSGRPRVGVGIRLLRTGPAPGPTTVSPSSWGEIKALHR